MPVIYTLCVNTNNIFLLLLSWESKKNVRDRFPLKQQFCFVVFLPLSLIFFPSPDPVASNSMTTCSLILYFPSIIVIFLLLHFTGNWQEMLDSSNILLIHNTIVTFLAHL